MQSITRIFRLWYRSLSFFYPKNIRLFSLITLKSIRQVYPLLFNNGSVLFSSLLFIFVLAVLFRYSHTAQGIFLCFAWMLASFAVIVMCRPSLTKKDSTQYFESYNYYTSWVQFARPGFDWFSFYYIMTIVCVLVVTGLFFLLDGGMWLLAASNTFAITGLQLLICLLGGPVSFFIQPVVGSLQSIELDSFVTMPFYLVSSPIFILSALFLFDSGISRMQFTWKQRELFHWKNVSNALIMILHHWPIIAVLQGILYGIVSLVHLFAMQYSINNPIICTLILLLIYPCIVCVYTTVYTKCFYEQVPLYRMGPA